jgi:hypothetical protein
VVNNDFATLPGCDHRKPMGERFKLAQPKTIRQRWQNKYIRLIIILSNAVARDRSYPLDFWVRTQVFRNIDLNGTNPQELYGFRLK